MLPLYFIILSFASLQLGKSGSFAVTSGFNSTSLQHSLMTHIAIDNANTPVPAVDLLSPQLDALSPNSESSLSDSQVILHARYRDSQLC